MQQYHRNRHRLIWTILTPLVVIILLLGILSRPDWPTMDTLPGTTNTEQSGK